MDGEVQEKKEAAPGGRGGDDMGTLMHIILGHGHCGGVGAQHSELIIIMRRRIIKTILIIIMTMMIAAREPQTAWDSGWHDAYASYSFLTLPTCIASPSRSMLCGIASTARQV